MPVYQEKTSRVQVAVYDGELVGVFDPVFGKVVPNTCPKWFPALTEEVDTIVGREVIAGSFICTSDGLFFGEGNAWRPVERGSRIVIEEDAARSTSRPISSIRVFSAAEFIERFEPA